MAWKVNSCCSIRMLWALAVLWSLGCSVMAATGNEGAGFDRVRWEKERKEMDFTQEGFDLPEQERIDNSSFLWAVLLEILRYTGIVVVVIGLVVLLIKLLGGLSFRKKQKAPKPISHEDAAPLTPTSLEGLRLAIQHAVNDGHYKEAIRLYYTLCLRHLLRSGMASEGPDKTNWEYVFEIRDETVAGKFAQLTSFFEFVWFGDGPGNEHTFKLSRPQFEQFIESLSHEQAK